MSLSNAPAPCRAPSAHQDRRLWHGELVLHIAATCLTKFAPVSHQNRTCLTQFAPVPLQNHACLTRFSSVSKNTELSRMAQRCGGHPHRRLVPSQRGPRIIQHSGRAFHSFPLRRINRTRCPSLAGATLVPPLSQPILLPSDGFPFDFTGRQQPILFAHPGFPTLAFGSPLGRYGCRGMRRPDLLYGSQAPARAE